MAGIDRVVGYERDARGFLLSDKLLPVKDRGSIVPTPIVKYYMGIASYLGAGARDFRMQLFVNDLERRDGGRNTCPRRVGSLDRKTRRTRQRTDGIAHPGAQYGAAKCWLPEYFAQVGRSIDRELAQRC